jgi:hypothetical protein
MLEINLGYTAPINRPGQPPLTIDQVWAGLTRKVTHAQEFVPVIVACEVLSDQHSPQKSGGSRTVSRRVTFRPGAGPMHSDTVREECVLHPPCRVDFCQEDGTKIANYITTGEDGDLFMTYVFQWVLPEMEEGSEETERLRVRYKEVSQLCFEDKVTEVAC